MQTFAPTPFTRSALSIAALSCLLSACGSSGTAVIPEGTAVQLSVLATTDLHQNVLSYDYYQLAPQTGKSTLGLAATAPLIQAARIENPNNVLLDDGDAIQGTLLGDFQAQAQPVPCSSTLAIHKAMNALNYDGGGLGNHEFNYGLPFLSQVMNKDLGVTGVSKPAGDCGAPTFPVVNTNVMSVSSKAPILSPYALINKTFTGTTPTGESISVPVNIGIMGFVPPQILDWDAKNLAGKVYVNGVVESATQYLPELRAKGADVVVALSHGGLDASPYSPTMENGSFHLAKVPGVDAMIVGHSHLVFPVGKEINAAALDGTLAALPAGSVDAQKGFVNGVPTVMAQSWGRRLGVIKLSLVYQGGKWVVQKDKTTVESRGLTQGQDFTVPANYVTPDPGVAALVDTEHQATIAYAKQALGVTTDFEMSSHFAMAGDVSAIQIVNQAQIDYVKNFLATTTDPVLKSYANIPVISCSAPFKAGRNGITDFTDVAAGASSASPFALQVRNPGDLYLYGNNNIQAVKIKGSDLKVWLEWAASQFGTINPASTAAQDLAPIYGSIYNYDVFYALGNALKYQIDVTQKPLFDISKTPYANIGGSRIRNLTFNGKPVGDNDDFIVATNDYRASGGGGVPGLDGSKTIIKSPDANQNVVAAFLKKQPAITRAANGSDRSWSFVKATTAGPVYLRSQPGKLAIAKTNGIAQVTAEGAAGTDGFSRYTVDLSK